MGNVCCGNHRTSSGNTSALNDVQILAGNVLNVKLSQGKGLSDVFPDCHICEQQSELGQRSKV